MKRVTATQGRQQLFKLLDEAERGEEIVLERNGVRFRLVLEARIRKNALPSPIIIDDDEVLDGQWSWVEDEEGDLTFQVRT